MILTVIIRDPSPFVFMQEPPHHRSVKIELTEEQVKALELRVTGMNCGHEVKEEIGFCFIEEDS